MSNVRIAVVHDWLVDFAGSERVLAEILCCFPHADLFALIDRMPVAQRAALGPRTARTSFLQHMPGAARHLGLYLPLMPLAIEQLDVTGYELVISSSHAVAKGVIPSPDALHVGYVHSPMRYAWDLQHAYLAGERLGRGLGGVAGRWLLHRLRLWDQRSAAGVDRFVANSAFVARRILKAYRRSATVIHPPVDTEFFRPGGSRGPRDGYVTMTRLMSYKRVDLIVNAFAAMPDRQLVVIGDGPQLSRLKAVAPANVRLVGRIEPDAVREHLQRASAFVFAAVEDFGIAPLEAQACGTPVIALARGGVAETVRGLEHGAPTGAFFEAQTPAALAAAVREFEASRERISEAACRENAERFSAERFRREFSAFVEGAYGDWLEFRRAGAAGDFSAWMG